MFYRSLFCQKMVEFLTTIFILNGSLNMKNYQEKIGLSHRDPFCTYIHRFYMFYANECNHFKEINYPFYYFGLCCVYIFRRTVRAHFKVFHSFMSFVSDCLLSLIQLKNVKRFIIECFFNVFFFFVFV
jgi:hypothetical protein